MVPFPPNAATAAAAASARRTPHLSRSAPHQRAVDWLQGVLEKRYTAVRATGVYTETDGGGTQPEDGVPVVADVSDEVGDDKEDDADPF